MPGTHDLPRAELDRRDLGQRGHGRGDVVARVAEGERLAALDPQAQ